LGVDPNATWDSPTCSGSGHVSIAPALDTAAAVIILALLPLRE